MHLFFQAFRAAVQVKPWCCSHLKASALRDSRSRALCFPFVKGLKQAGKMEEQRASADLRSGGISAGTWLGALVGPCEESPSPNSHLPSGWQGLGLLGPQPCDRAPSASRQKEPLLKQERKVQIKQVEGQTVQLPFFPTPRSSGPTCVEQDVVGSALGDVQEVPNQSWQMQASAEFHLCAKCP